MSTGMHFYESYDSYIRLTYAIIERKIGKILPIGRATAIVGKRNYCACAKWEDMRKPELVRRTRYMKMTG